MRLLGKVALVTGAQQGIGRAIALALATDGADVAVNYLDDRQAADAVAGEVRARGRRALPVAGDVSRAEEARRMVEAAAAGLGGLDVLVNFRASSLDRASPGGPGRPLPRPAAPAPSARRRSPRLAGLARPLRRSWPAAPC
jgi:NAD(P)-dependent dehydrogenase (short-subunit alcohol dehydrogenase family)